MIDTNDKDEILEKVNRICELKKQLDKIEEIPKNYGMRDVDKKVVNSALDLLKDNIYTELKDVLSMNDRYKDFFPDTAPCEYPPTYPGGPTYSTGTDTVEK